ncbi:hypothetical protein P692DRAFT_20669776, partial [Suillus brevipes Sb2]
IGVHNYMRECDIVADLVPGDTSMTIQPEYYTDNNPRNQTLWDQLAKIQRTS